MLLATSVRITSAPETSDRAMQSKTTLPSPRVSKKRTLKVVFSLQLFCLFAAPPGSPPQSKSCAARLCGGHNRWSRTSKGIRSWLWVYQTVTKPRLSIHCPPSHGLPRPRSDPRDVDDVSMVRTDRGSSIAPTGLKCPEGSRPTARRPPPPPPERRSRQDTSPADATAASGYNQSSIWIQDLWGSLGVLDTLGGEGGGGSRAREVEPFHERRRNRDRERAPTETS